MSDLSLSTLFIFLYLPSSFFFFLIANFSSFKHILTYFPQRDEGSLPVTNGPRRRPTFWAVPWRSCPLLSLSTRPKGCSTPAHSEEGRTMAARAMAQVNTRAAESWISFVRSCAWFRITDLEKKVIWYIQQYVLEVDEMIFFSDFLRFCCGVLAAETLGLLWFLHH